jgi:hypothetical protein
MDAFVRHRLSLHHCAPRCAAYDAALHPFLLISALVELIAAYAPWDDPLVRLERLVEAVNSRQLVLSDDDRRRLGKHLQRPRSVALLLCEWYCKAWNRPLPVRLSRQTRASWRARQLPCIGGCGLFYPLENPARSASWVAKLDKSLAYGPDRELYCADCARNEYDPRGGGMRMHKWPNLYVRGISESPSTRFSVPGLTRAFRRLLHQRPNELLSCARTLFYRT